MQSKASEKPQLARELRTARGGHSPLGVGVNEAVDALDDVRDGVDSRVQAADTPRRLSVAPAPAQPPAMRSRQSSNAWKCGAGRHLACAGHLRLGSSERTRENCCFADVVVAVEPIKAPSRRVPVHHSVAIGEDTGPRAKIQLEPDPRTQTWPLSCSERVFRVSSRKAIGQLWTVNAPDSPVTLSSSGWSSELSVDSLTIVP